MWNNILGVNQWELLGCHLLTLLWVLIVQVVLCILIVLLLFKIPIAGSISTIAILTLLQGICGMCFGFLISAACNTERSCILMTLSTFYPTLLISGVIWPIEGMPRFLYYISWHLPLTRGISALRSIIIRGWGLTHHIVYLGFFYTIAWTMVFLVLSVIIFKYKR